MDSYRHHVIPRHEWKRRFGNLIGFNAPDNVVWLTLEQHIQVHRILYEMNGNEYDNLAANMLSGNIGKEDSIRLLPAIANRGRKHTVAQNLAKSQYMKVVAQIEKFREDKRILMMGNKCALGARYNRTEGDNKAKSLRMLGTHNALGFKHPKEYGEAISKRLSGIPQQKVSCRHCRKVGGKTLMVRYHFDNCKKKDAS